LRTSLRTRLARHLLPFAAVSAETDDESWTLPIRIGMWTMFVCAFVMVMVVVMMN